ncbi:SRPBCC family protein [Antrihabitans cavernicola]|uniref:SRPBCC family protein n=1 Tax=Antrihabitans cavernicola TaxID=2495913 RepID=A0A5A7SCI7_9NOCA|nr:SRPBCC family protein [Spelaeibacter cavernicola]KAA0022215.1 SRPBCC family protein [Spelaeibacter cavernicola]
MSAPLEASIDIAATPDKVWAVVSDLSRMPEWSPQCRRMQLLGQLREGALTINLNKDGWKVWPTTSTVVRVEQDKAIAFRMNENRTTWSYELTPSAIGTTVTERRVESAGGIPKPITFAIDKLLGGTPNFEHNLVAGMHQGLKKIKGAVEQG